MAPSLILNNNSLTSPLTVDLSNYLRLPDGEGMDPANPSFTDKIFARSLLKPGATYALEQLTEKELAFPLALNSVTNSGVVQLVAQVNQLINSPGATVSWQDTGLSQPTIFDLLSGQFDIEYSYRQQEKFWILGKLRLFSNPLGHTGSPRPYAAGSAVGPLLMISPYASGGALAVGASTQGGVAGFGGQQQGPSSGVFYSGNPSLAGDAQALLQISYVGPLPNGATNAGVVPYAAVSLLPDPYYQPLITMPEVSILATASTGGSSCVGIAARVPVSTIIGSQYVTVTASSTHGGAGSAAFNANFSFSPLHGASSGIAPTVLWGGLHRVFAIARGSEANTQSVLGLTLQLLPNALTNAPQVASIAGPPVPLSSTSPDWSVYDLGTFSLQASQPPQATVNVLARGGYLPIGGGSAPAAIDVAGFVMLPDNATWFINPGQIYGSTYGWPLGVASGAPLASAPYTNTFVLDDVLGNQFMYAGPSQLSAPSPIGAIPSSSQITQYARGLVPRPDPQRGLPILAILGVAQPMTASVIGVGGGPIPGASWLNAQNLRTMAQVNILERARYVLP